MTRRSDPRPAELLEQGQSAGGEAEPLYGRASPLRMRSAGVNWHCACGQEYRVRTASPTFWPRNSEQGFRVEPATSCIDCGADLEERFALDAARLVSASLLG